MRLLRFRDRGAGPTAARLAAMTETPDGVRLSPLDALGLGGPAGEAVARADLAALLAADPDLEMIRRSMTTREVDAPTIEPGTTRILAPLRPGKIVGVGLNYRDHVAEQSIEVPERPVLFAKFANTVVGDGDPIVRHQRTDALDFEAELAVVIGRPAARVSRADALASVAGYTAANDVTARDLQGVRGAVAPGAHGDGQWLRAKGSDTFCPLGPVLVTRDELVDPSHLAVRSWRTMAGAAAEPAVVAMQDGVTSDMIFGVEWLVAFVSEVIMLEPGDVILTGTPAGVGVFRDPPAFLQPGDVVTIEVERVGRLSNPVVDADGRAPDGSPAARLLAGPGGSVA